MNPIFAVVARQPPPRPPLVLPPEDTPARSGLATGRTGRAGPLGFPERPAGPRARVVRFLCRVGFCLAVALPAAGQRIPLVVPAGTPLSVQLEKRLRLQGVGQPVAGRVVEPVFAFQKEVIPAGSELTGHVVRLQPVSTPRRVKAVLHGDLTPLHEALIQFDQLRFRDGRTRRVQTEIATRLGLVVPFESRSPARTKHSWIGTTEESARGALGNARQQIAAALHSPQKWERLQEKASARLPYHPQFLPAQTRFSVPLREPLAFGTDRLTAPELARLGLPPPDTVVTARLLTEVHSQAAVGSPVEAVVSAPVYTAGRQLLVPEGTRLLGRVTQAQPAAWFRRGGQLRLQFQQMELPAPVARGKRQRTMEAIVVQGAATRPVRIQVDEEGGMKTVEPRTRFLAPALQIFLGIPALDEANNSPSLPNANRAVRALAGASGLGLVGSLAAQFSAEAAAGLGYYGAAWSVFNHVITPGHNVLLAPGTPLQIRFGAARE